MRIYELSKKKKMRIYEGLVSGEKLFSEEEDYMPASDYANNTAITVYREELFRIIMEVPAVLSFKIRYAAVAHFDRFASKQEASVVLGKDCKLVALTCLITAAKVEENDIFIYDLASGELLDFIQAHVLSAQVHLLQGCSHTLVRFDMESDPLSSSLPFSLLLLPPMAESIDSTENGE